MKENILFKTCYNCMNCKKKDNKIYCKEKKFSNVDEDTIRFYTPYDFDCEDWIES